MANETWKFNVIYSIHNHSLTDKLVDHFIICLIISEERELVSDMTLNIVASKNILVSLKRKIHINISNIKQIYNVCARDNKELR